MTNFAAKALARLRRNTPADDNVNYAGTGVGHGEELGPRPARRIGRQMQGLVNRVIRRRQAAVNNPVVNPVNPAGVHPPPAAFTFTVTPIALDDLGFDNIYTAVQQDHQAVQQKYHDEIANEFKKLKENAENIKKPAYQREDNTEDSGHENGNFAKSGHHPRSTADQAESEVPEHFRRP